MQKAYWSFDDQQLVFQSNNKAWNVSCDQMFLMNADATFKTQNAPHDFHRKRTYYLCLFLADNKHIIYASTHLVDDNCPEVPCVKTAIHLASV